MSEASQRPILPLTERCTNTSSPPKSPSKIPLPASPAAKMPKLAFTAPSPAQGNVLLSNRTSSTTAPQNTNLATENVEDVLANPQEATAAQKPDLVKRITEVHKEGQMYISPSDEILSPTTKKLSEVKNRRFDKTSTSKSSYSGGNIFKRNMMVHRDGKGV